MDLNELMRNIRRINVLKEIEEAIEKVKLEYSNLITEQTCKIYSSLLYEELNNRHVSVRLVSTGNLDLTYDHTFILVNSSNIKYYLIDLTYSQFKDDTFKDLLDSGYQEVNDYDINKYLEIVSKDKTNVRLDDLYYLDTVKRRNI